MNFAAAYDKALKAVRRAARSLREIPKRIQKRIRLWIVCRKLKIKPMKWQIRYIMGNEARLPCGRRNGKTTAVILRAIVEKPDSMYDLRVALARDPDFHRSRATARWTVDEYMRFCIKAGIYPLGGKRRGH